MQPTVPLRKRSWCQEFASWILFSIALGVLQVQAKWTEELDHGGENGFPTYNEAQSILDGWLQRYPAILAREVIGKSYEGRDMYVYILRAGAGAAFEERPQVLFTSLMHAREPAGLTVLLYVLGNLLELNEKGHAEAVYILQTKQVFFVPFVNPDGYIANEDQLIKNIRKNRRPTCKQAPKMGGVDLNRNFGFHWSNDFQACNEEYQGEAPFSEPETQAFKKLIESHHFVAAINFHSYGSMLTHPYNFGDKRLPVDDERIYQEISDVFKFSLFGPAIKTVGYTTSGESDDWMYATHGIISMSPEVGPESGGFWPAANLVRGIDKRNYIRNMYVVKKTGLELGVSLAIGQQSPEQGKENLKLTIANKGLTRSIGGALNVAISGALRPHMPVSPSNESGVLEEGEPHASQKPLRFVQDSRDASAAPILAFQVRPLERRSNTTFQLVLPASMVATLPTAKLTICAVEVPQAATPLLSNSLSVCQCLGPSAFSEISLSGSGKLVQATLVRFQATAAATELQKACNAAATLGAPLAQATDPILQQEETLGKPLQKGNAPLVIDSIGAGWVLLFVASILALGMFVRYILHRRGSGSTGREQMESVKSGKSMSEMQLLICERESSGADDGCNDA